ncbi:DUF3010 family protein [Sphingomonas sp. Tas61C01]|uniref:DUF3010 family protein n=1 Tax=Sphingomonas sp. Tas61C01 TaxID=3458297 RepID=UPI00403E5F4B
MNSNQRCATGIILSAGTAYFATIAQDAAGRVRLIKSRSGEIELPGTSQIELRMFATFLLQFLDKRQVRSATIVPSPRSGTYTAPATNYLIEALIKLAVPEIFDVHPSKLRAFGDRDDIHVPGVDRQRLNRLDAEKQHRAILAASFHLDRVTMLDCCASTA